MATITVRCPGCGERRLRLAANEIITEDRVCVACARMFAALEAAGKDRDASDADEEEVNPYPQPRRRGALHLEGR